ncbi:MAG TPA: immunoglobulin domain-containing protein [Candidatus Limnocylindria bacterium]|nr:immunoglobulin domain-containing protein [Candidatus Limnocylindria bacterium]
MLNALRSSGLLAALAALSTVFCSHAQVRSDGFIDPTFGSVCLSNAGALARAISVQDDGKVFVGGDFSSSCGNAVVRLRTNGTTDTFNSPFFAGDQVNALAVLSGGKVLVGGNMRNAGTAFGVARLNANGTLDNIFQRTVPGLAIVINALVVQPDNRVVAAGYDFSVAGQFAGVVLRRNENGSVDGTFTQGTTMRTVENQISALALQSGKILVGGTFTNYSSNITLKRDGIARLNADGSLDTSFNPLFSNSRIYALLVQPDNKILVAGEFDVDGGTRMLTRLNPNGDRDTGFTSINTVGGAVGLSLALEDNGKILLGQSFGVMRLTTNGALDTTFGPRNDANSLGTAAVPAAALALTAEDQILVGAGIVSDDIRSRRAIARLFSNIPPAPVILTNPVSLSVEAGSTATFSVIATGAPPVTYQWRKNGAAIQNATESTLTFVNVNSTHAGNYTVVVSNPGGSVTSDVAQLAVIFHTSPLDIRIEGNGTVTPNLDGKPLEIGRTFTLTAKPGRGSLFSHWSGFESSTSPVLTFIMQTNELLQANFVASPFIPVLGVYNGLFFDTNAPAHENAGSFNLKLDERGGFSGTLRNGAKPRKFKGVFSLANVAQVAVPASGAQPALNLALQIDTANGIITGTVSNGVANSWLVADRNPFSSPSPSPFAGSYNIVFPGSENPAGDGFGTLKVSSSGKVSGNGTLADKSPLKVLSATAVAGRVPVYVSLYRGAGSLFGWLTLTNENGLAGPIWWTKPGSAGGAFYPEGFTNEIEVLSELYIPKPTGVPVLPIADVEIIVVGGNSLSFTSSATLGSDNKLAGDNQLTLTLVPAKGTFSGSFADPLSGKKRTIKGVVLPNRNEAHGSFFGTDESGRVVVDAAP